MQELKMVVNQCTSVSHTLVYVCYVFIITDVSMVGGSPCVSPTLVYVCYVFIITDVSMVGGTPCVSPTLVYVCLCFYDCRCEYGWWRPLVTSVSHTLVYVCYVFMVTDVSMVGGVPYVTSVSRTLDVSMEPAMVHLGSVYVTSTGAVCSVGKVNIYKLYTYYYFYIL